MRGVRCFWVAVAAGVVVTALVAPSAHASCGHYVIIGNPRVDSTPEKALPFSPSQQQQAPAPVRPCSGPNCSENRQPLTPPAPKPAPVEEQRWGYDVPLAVPPHGDPHSFFLSETLGRPIRGACSIYHPPR
jgi:hypothetical protein